MKKYNLLKVIAITVVVAWVLTLLIPGSYLDYSGNITNNGIAGVGIWGLFSNTSISISYFNGIAVFIIAIAILYSILGKVEVYNSFVKKVTEKFQNKKGLFVVITTIIFGVLAALVSDAMVLLLFVPFIYKVMKELEIDKKVILSSTIIASLLGAMCGIYDSSLFTTFNLTVNTLLLVKVILLVISLFILIMFIAPRKEKGSKKITAKKATKTEIKKTDKKVTVKKPSSKEKKVNKVVYAILSVLLGTFGIQKFYAGKIKSGILSVVFCWTGVPTILSIAEFITILTEKADKEGKITVTSSRRTNVLFATSIVLFILMVIGSMIPWSSLFTKFTAFTDFNTWLGNLKLGKYAIFSNIIGAPVVADVTTGSSTGVIAAFGTWKLTDIAILTFVISAIVALCNNIKFNDFIAESTKGIKKALPVAITAMLISIVLVILVTTGVNITISNWILSWTKSFNIVTATLASMVGSVTTADFYYYVSTLGTVFTKAAGSEDLYGVMALIMQSIYYLMMVIAPTSVALIIGLYSMDIPYGKWFKYIWKALLSIFIVILIAAIIVYVVL